MTYGRNDIMASIVRKARESHGREKGVITEDDIRWITSTFLRISSYNGYNSDITKEDFKHICERILSVILFSEYEYTYSIEQSVIDKIMIEENLGKINHPYYKVFWKRGASAAIKSLTQIEL